MKMSRQLLPCLVALPAVWGQSATPPPPAAHYVMVNCLKLVPGARPPEVTKFHKDYTIPLYRSMMEANPRLRRVAYQRNAVPGGAAAECDYRVVSIYAGWGGGPTRLTPEHMKKAGLTISVDEYFAKRNALYKSVRSEILRTWPGHGDMKKDDWLVTSYVKIAPGRFSEYVSRGTEIWQPLSKERIQQGKMAGSFRAGVSFAGTESPYNAVAISVFNKWDQILGDFDYMATFAKVHPGKSYEVLARTGRDISQTIRVEIDQVMELIDSTQAAPGLASGN